MRRQFAQRAMVVERIRSQAHSADLLDLQSDLRRSDRINPNAMNDVSSSMLATFASTFVRSHSTIVSCSSRRNVSEASCLIVARRSEAVNFMT